MGFQTMGSRMAFLIGSLMVFFGFSVAFFRFISSINRIVMLQPTGRKLPSLGVYRSLNGFVAFFLVFLGLPVIMGDSKNVNELFS